MTWIYLIRDLRYIDVCYPDFFLTKCQMSLGPIFSYFLIFFFFFFLLKILFSQLKTTCDDYHNL